jgi:hypothetical protein
MDRKRTRKVRVKKNKSHLLFLSALSSAPGDSLAVGVIRGPTCPIELSPQPKSSPESDRKMEWAVPADADTIDTPLIVSTCT